MDYSFPTHMLDTNQRIKLNSVRFGSTSSEVHKMVLGKDFLGERRNNLIIAEQSHRCIRKLIKNKRKT